jgi:uncharacterized membrane protein
VSLNVELLPLFFPLTAGISILGPAIAIGFYELGRRRAAGLNVSWRHGTVAPTSTVLPPAG